MISRRLILFALGSMIATIFIAIAPQVDAFEDSCEVCSAEICIPVYEEYGFTNCNENYTYITVYHNPLDGNEYTNIYTICKATGSCLTPPPMG